MNVIGKTKLKVAIENQTNELEFLVINKRVKTIITNTISMILDVLLSDAGTQITSKEFLQFPNHKMSSPHHQ